MTTILADLTVIPPAYAAPVELANLSTPNAESGSLQPE
jgi:hypothetical protein